MPFEQKYPHVARWYQHIASYGAEHPGLQGDKAKAGSLIAGIFGASTPAAAAAAGGAAAEDDDDVDLFGSDEEDDAEAERVKAERVAEYNKKKAEKEAVKGKTVHKSVVTLQVKPWDDETDMKKLEEAVRSIEMPGLLWGACAHNLLVHFFNSMVLCA